MKTFFDKLSKNTQNFIQIRPVGAEVFHTGGRTDRHDESISLKYNQQDGMFSRSIYFYKLRYMF
jgi:hypothetical protein